MDWKLPSKLWIGQELLKSTMLAGGRGEYKVDLTAIQLKGQFGEYSPTHVSQSHGAKKSGITKLGQELLELQRQVIERCPAFFSRAGDPLWSSRRDESLMEQETR